MAVMIRFSPMARDVSRAAYPPTLYRRLAISLRSLVIMLPINYSIILPHPRVQPYLLIYSHTRPDTDIRPYTIIALNQFDMFRSWDLTILPLSTRRHKITRFITKDASKDIYQDSIARH